VTDLARAAAGDGQVVVENHDLGLLLVMPEDAGRDHDAEVRTS
jgi:hypothetical protein